LEAHEGGSTIGLFELLKELRLNFLEAEYDPSAVTAQLQEVL
jgi:hypothetical protein